MFPSTSNLRPASSPAGTGWHSSQSGAPHYARAQLRAHHAYSRYQPTILPDFVLEMTAPGFGRHTKVRQLQPMPQPQLNQLATSFVKQPSYSWTNQGESGANPARDSLQPELHSKRYSESLIF